MNRAQTSKPATIDEYLATLPADKRATLEKLRKAIKAAAPGAEECISYSMPAFRHEGKVIVWFGAAKNHCSFFPGSHPIDVFKDDLEEYETSKGTIRFPVDEPLPSTLVRKLVKARIAQSSAAEANTGRTKPGKRARKMNKGSGSSSPARP